MTRKLGIVAAVVVLQAGVVVGLGGEAWAVPPPLVGTVTCSAFVGTGTLHPKLTVAGGPGGIKITFKGTATGCVGVSTRLLAPVTVSSGTVTGSGYFTGITASKCANFQGLAPPLVTVGNIKMKVRWTLTNGAAVQKSKVVYSASPAPDYSNLAVPLNMPLNLGRVPPLGGGKTTTVVGGSYAGSVVQNTLMNIAAGVVPCPVGPLFAFATGTLAF
jgi:hypothetical protein